MEELIAQVADKTGLDTGVAGNALEIILKFLHGSASSDAMNQLIEAIPGASGVVGAASGGGSGLFGGALGAMGVMNDLSKEGLSMGQVQDVTKGLVEYAKDKIGEDEVDQIISSVPGLSQFV